LEVERYTAMELDQQALEKLHEVSGELSGETQYLTFRLGQQEYGIPIIEVQEIKGWASITPIPNSPSHVLGVFNLRGTIIPVVDLRKRFGLDSVGQNEFTVVIVVSMGERLAGLLVDSVSDVVNVKDELVMENPEADTNMDQRFFSGLIESADKLVILLNVMQISADLLQES
jgi:purine-binding chemotaxis protein CheW